MSSSNTTRPSRVLLHIGTEKTGSTTLQQFFGRNRERFLDHGVLYPRSAADRFDNHIGLAAYAADDHLDDDLRQQLEVSDESSLQRYRQSLEKSLREEVDRHAQNADTLVFSNEHCHSRLSTEAEISRVADLIRPLAKDVRVVVYLRRQDMMAVSLYSTYLKNGGTRKEVFPAAVSSSYYDFEKLLEKWSNIFGCDAITARIYDREAFPNGDIVADFMTTLGVELSPGFYRPPRVNASFSPAAQEVVRRINQRVQAADPALYESDVESIISQLMSRFAGPGRRPARSAAEKFYQQFTASNDRVRRRWFPDQGQLFSESFDMYPEEDDLERLSLSDAADITIELLDAPEKRRLLPDARPRIRSEPRLFGISRVVYRALPISSWTRRKLRDQFLSLFFPSRLEALYRYLNAPYRGDQTSPSLRDNVRAAFRKSAESELTRFLESEEEIIFPESAAPQISVVSVVFNQPELTLKCLRSLASVASESIEVILVDNASDATTKKLLSRLRNATIKANQRNEHYIAGINGALDLIRGDLVLLLNNDTVIEPEALAQAVRSIQSSPDIGAVGPLVLSIDGLILENGCAIGPDGACHPRNRGDEPELIKNTGGIIDVDYVSGCFLLTPAELLRRVGGLDCRYAPAYYDDADYCTQLWELGFRVTVDRKARITHFESAASSDNEVAKLVERNRGRFVEKYDWQFAHQARLKAQT